MKVVYDVEAEACEVQCEEYWGIYAEYAKEHERARMH